MLARLCRLLIWFSDVSLGHSFYYWLNVALRNWVLQLLRRLLNWHRCCVWIIWRCISLSTIVLLLLLYMLLSRCLLRGWTFFFLLILCTSFFNFLWRSHTRRCWNWGSLSWPLVDNFSGIGFLRLDFGRLLLLRRCTMFLYRFRLLDCWVLSGLKESRFYHRLLYACRRQW